MTLNETQRDVLGELINVGLGHAAGQLNELLGHKVRLAVPRVEVLSVEEAGDRFEEFLGRDISAVTLDFSGGMDGSATLMVPPDSSEKLVDAIARADDMDPASLDVQETIEEVGNILINSILGAVANGLHQKLDFTVPCTRETSVREIVIAGVDQEKGEILTAHTGFSIDSLDIAGSVSLIFQVGSLQNLIEALDGIDLDG